MNGLSFFWPKDQLTYNDSNGDAVVKYKIKKFSNSKNFKKNRFDLNFIDLTSNDYEVSIADFNNLVIIGNRIGEPSTRTFQFSAYDGTDWSEWTSLDVVNMGNKRPSFKYQ